MNPSSGAEAEKIFSTVKKSPGSAKVEVVIIPPAIYIPLFKSRGVSLGCQNIHHRKKGAFTGEISAEMAKNSGCGYVLVGHSERRKIFKETDEDVSDKAKGAMRAGLVPIICIGETKVEKNKGKTSSVIKRQLKVALEDLDPKNKLIVAYEPVWAIGSGNPCKPETAFKMRILIKKMISKIFEREIAEKTPILYGGSVNLGNCKNYIKEAKFDGLLVGGVSLKPKEFSKMIKEIQ